MRGHWKGCCERDMASWMWLVLGEWSAGKITLLWGHVNGTIWYWGVETIQGSMTLTNLRDFMKPLQAFDLPMGSNFINIGRYNDLISCVEHTARLASVIELQMNGTLRVYSPCYCAEWSTWVVCAEFVSCGKCCYFMVEKGSEWEFSIASFHVFT